MAGQRRALTRWMVDEMVRVIAQDPDLCITLNPDLIPANGRVRVYRDGQRLALHRYLYRRLEGEELEASAILVEGGCETAGCYNPYHRIIAKRMGIRLRRTCPNGHPYTDKTRRKTGRYKCTICIEERNARRRKQAYPRGWCHEGHRMAGKNLYTYTTKDGKTARRCRTCHVERQRQYRERKREHD